jgi:hypothetical protein
MVPSKLVVDLDRQVMNVYGLNRYLKSAETTAKPLTVVQPAPSDSRDEQT